MLFSRMPCFKNFCNYLARKAFGIVEYAAAADVCSTTPHRRRRKNMGKAFARLIALLACVVCGVASTAAAGTVEVFFNNENLRYTLFTTNQGQTEYVQLEKVANMFQLQLDVDATDGRIVLQYGEKSLSFFPDQPAVISARKSYPMTFPAQNIEGILMVPLEFLTRTLPLIYEYDLLWDAQQRRITVGIQNLELLSLYASPYADYTRIAVQLSQNVPYKITEKIPSLLIFELPQATFNLPENPLQINNAAVKHVKVIDSFGTTQVLIRLGDEFARYAHKTKDNPPRLIIDVFTTDDAVAEEETPTPEPEATPAEEADSDVPETIVEQDLATPEQEGTAAVGQPFSLKTIVVDPGHGGSDQGVVVVPAVDATPALMEKQLTLHLGKLLSTHLAERLGVSVTLTREGDDFLSGEMRATVANSSRADVLISLHINNSMSAQPGGLEVYIMDYGSLDMPQGAKAQVLDYAQAKYIEQSKRLAEQIVAAYRARNSGARAVVKRAPLFTLKGATMPSVHIELGYASNASERQNMTQEAFQQTLIGAIADGIAAFKKGEEL